MACIFCKIVKGNEPASVIYEDAQCMAFMGIRPIHPGECMIIPKDHIDHFTDIEDKLAAHIMVVAQKIGHKMLTALEPKPKRIGYVVHGFGVAHAHLIIVPQHEEDDIVSGRHLKVVDGEIIADETINPLASRVELDRVATLLRQGLTKQDKFPII